MQHRRRLILKASTLIALGGRWCVAGAERYPNRPIKIVVPSVAGGILDVEVRRIAQRLAKALGQAVVIDNRPGASNTIGATGVAQAAADGYTLLTAGNSAMAIAPALMPQLAYHPTKHFEPIIQNVRGPAVLVCNPSLGVRTVQELIALARAKPGKLAYASNGVASLLHLLSEILCKTAGVEMLHVPYKGTGVTLISIMANETQIGFDFPPTSVAHVKAGKLTALLVTSHKRVPLLPDVPTASEMEIGHWSLRLGTGSLHRPVLRKRLSRISMRRSQRCCACRICKPTTPATVSKRWAVLPRSSANSSLPN